MKLDVADSGRWRRARGAQQRRRSANDAREVMGGEGRWGEERERRWEGNSRAALSEASSVRGKPSRCLINNARFSRR